MSRRLASIIALTFVFSLAFLVPVFRPVYAGDPSPTPPQTIEDIDNMMSEQNSFDKNLKEFCDKRSGDQMNLETWYSGKCTDDTFSGEGVGFSDIVILDLAEKLSGKKDPSQTFSKTLKSLFDALKTSYTPEARDLAIRNARQDFFQTNNDGLITQTGNLIGLLYQNQPSSTKSYLAYVTHNLQSHKVIHEVVAADTSQGIGFATFSPFLTIWMMVRNLAYIALVIFFVVYGFMMMFRVNLGQKTVITVQLAIPKLIVTLLIITFSYAIVGLIFDLMWVVIYLALGYLTSQGLLNTTIWKPGEAASGNGPLGLFGSLILNSVISGPATIFGVLSLFLGGLGAAVGTVVSFRGIGLIVILVVLIAVLISYAKLFIKLIGAFVSVVISLITAPLVLLGNALPGSQVIGTWLRSIVANLSVFPVTMIFLMFSYILMIQPLLGLCGGIEEVFRSIFGLTNSTAACEALFGVKDLVTGNAVVSGIPLVTPLTGFDATGLLALLGVGLLLMAAKYVDMVKDALKVPPFKYGSAIGDALKEGWKSAGYVPKVGSSPAYQKISEVGGLKAGKPIVADQAQKETEKPGA